MKNVIVAAVLGLSVATPALSQSTHTIHNPCERGPLPKVRIINDSKAEFIGFLQGIRPAMPYGTARVIAYSLCDDLSLVGDSRGLTTRLNQLLKLHGY